VLTEPVLVFYGKGDGDVSVLDRDAKELGVARRFRDKATKVAGYSIDEAGGASLGIKSPARWIGGGDYTVSDEKGTEVAT
jgi:hypothetical protein